MSKLKIALSATLFTLVPVVAVSAATLTNVPMQGGMAMPMVSYNATDGKIHVMMPMEVPALTPLLVSNPADSFDPADPWFDCVDPSRQGASFSRRYGFMMEAMTDPLPANTQMWIRKVSGPAELKAYRYKDTAPKAWQAVFGTDGVTNALYWNGMMFHPAFTAPPGTNNLSAAFELYLLDTTTGLEVPNSSSDLLLFDFTNVADGRPVLSLEQTITVAWPVNTATNWVLEGASNANASVWSTITNSPVVVDGKPCVVLAAGATAQFFRMRYQP